MYVRLLCRCVELCSGITDFSEDESVGLLHMRLGL
jgi:hypothetical protein